jgi:hypothetical protein
MIAERGIGVVSVEIHAQEPDEFGPFHRIPGVRGQDFGEKLGKLGAKTHEVKEKGGGREPRDARDAREGRPSRANFTLPA